MTDDRFAAEDNTAKRRRLAIIGGGSSGLICLKQALDFLSDWDIVCFEKSDRITGCWGNPYPGFVSTSTKYTTQLSCHTLFDAGVDIDDSANWPEFFREDQYGQYLDQFAERFSLRRHITLRCSVDRIQRGDQGRGWDLSLTRSREGQAETTTEHFDQVVLCTGLAAKPKQLDCSVKTLTVGELNRPDGLGHVTKQRIVVVGGGESAVDYANRFSNPALNNRVFLSLQSGIRVSPRYHPIRGVPSDFLRNRLMLSIHEDIRNWIGQRFVELRIRYQETFQWMFPKSGSKQTVTTLDEDVLRRHKEWAYKLTKAAKDDLFNMFHNKSDDFLVAVAEERITIIGDPTDRAFTTFLAFGHGEREVVEPDLVVPAVGYQAELQDLFAGQVTFGDFYLGCCHVVYDDLHAVGFARPIIGNIPTISEVQTRFVCGLISGEYIRPPDIKELHQADLACQGARYKKLDLNAMYPVEMFPYCDQLAKLMNSYPSLFAVGSLVTWCRMQLAPATTMHYFDRHRQLNDVGKSAPIYMPLKLVAFLLALKPLDWSYRLLRRLWKR